MGTDDQPGIIQMAVNEIFSEIQKNQDREFLIRVSYMEIYNEKVKDLLKPENGDLKMNELANGQIYVDCTESIAQNGRHIMECVSDGNDNRSVGATNMNEHSSRSHTVFRIIIESREEGATDATAAVKVGTLNLVDLAGSEKAEQSGATGSRFKEGTYINLSLLSLTTVINQLSDVEKNEKKYVNYRNSKLTRLLQHSLGGNAKTVIICTVTPAVVDETRSTLGFAMRARKIKNAPTVNEVMTDQAMIKRLQRMIASLEQELNAAKSNQRDRILAKISARQNCIVHPGRKVKEAARRRTWAPSTDEDSRFSRLVNDALKANAENHLMPPPSFFASKPCLTDILEHDEYNSPVILLEDEEFVPGEFVDLQRSPSPTQVPRVHTPHCMRQRLSLISEKDSSPGCGPSSGVSYQERCKVLERELLELQDFTRLEKHFHVHEDRPTCEQEIESLRASLESTNHR